MKLRAQQPAALEALPKQDRIHLPCELVDAPRSIALNDLAGRIERQAIELAERGDFGPVFADMRSAMRALIMANGYLRSENEHLTRAVSFGFMRTPLPPDRKDWYE